MELTINTFEYGKRPQVTLPSPDFLKIMKEEGIRKLVNDHYELLRQSTINGLFPQEPGEFEMAKEHAADFIIQICGGPEYYNQNRGRPMLVNRHAPFAITPEARLVWLDCYKNVLSKLDLPENVILSFWNYLDHFSHWMINTD
jgi:hemoglobin